MKYNQVLYTGLQSPIVSSQQELKGI